MLKDRSPNTACWPAAPLLPSYMQPMRCTPCAGGPRPASTLCAHMCAIRMRASTPHRNPTTQEAQRDAPGHGAPFGRSLRGLGTLSLTPSSRVHIVLIACRGASSAFFAIPDRCALQSYTCRFAGRTAGISRGRYSHNGYPTRSTVLKRSPTSGATHRACGL